MIKPAASILSWILNLFDPPPLVSMTVAQKVGRIIFLSGTLVIGSILVAMIGAVGLYLMEKGREFGDRPEIYKGLIIILTGIVVNTFCVLILVQLKRADHKLIPPTRPVETTPIGHLKVAVSPLTSSKQTAEPADSSVDPV
jgi:hypothetical protein